MVLILLGDRYRFFKSKLKISVPLGDQTVVRKKLLTYRFFSYNLAKPLSVFALKIYFQQIFLQGLT